MSSRLLALSLGTRIFLISGSLLVLALGSSVAATYLLGTRIADREARERIQASHSVQSAFQQQRYEQLQLLAQVFVANQDLRALLAEAAAIRDSATILHQLTQRQADLGYD